MASEFPSAKLSSGDEMPQFGLGTWLSPPGEVKQARHIDTAAIYGNEKEVGDGIKASGIPREDIWVTTKLWNTAHHPEDVKKALDSSLNKLQLEYVDLYLMHYPCAMDPDVEGIKVIDVPFTQTWAEMEKLLDTGKCKNIGISSTCSGPFANRTMGYCSSLIRIDYSKSELDTLLANCKVKPAVHQLERHPYLPQHKFMEFHRKNGIHITAYSPLGNTNPTYASRDRFEPIIKNAHVLRLAQKYSATPAQILISLQVADGASVVPKSVREKRVLENAKYIPLTSEDRKEIYSNISVRARFGDFSDVIGYKYYADLPEYEGETMR